MKLAFWKTDWFLGLLVALSFLFAGRSDLLQSLERKAYNLGVQASSRVASDQVEVIAIDEQSIANLGRWPWPRDIHAKMVDLLAAAQAKAVGNTVLLLEPQVHPGLTYINKLLEFYAASALKTTTDPALQAEAANLEALLPCACAIIDKILHKQPEQRFQTGAEFARALRACAAYAAKGT